MVKIIIIEKNGELKESKFIAEKNELYKKCKFKKPDDFTLRHTWLNKKAKFSFKKVSLYARDKGKANTENKYDLPPPVDNILYFGTCALVATDDDDLNTDLTLEEWNKFYEHLFGGFENLDDTAIEDENESDELDDIPDEMKTKSGYLKDDFVVDDVEIQNQDDTSISEGEWEDDISELEYEDYCYSDED